MSWVSPWHSQETTACISIKPCCCGADQRDIYTAKWCKGPHSNDTMQILPLKSHFGYDQQLSFPLPGAFSCSISIRNTGDICVTSWDVYDASIFYFICVQKLEKQSFKRLMTKYELCLTVALKNVLLKALLVIILKLIHTKGDGPKRSYRGECSVWALHYVRDFEASLLMSVCSSVWN